MMAQCKPLNSDFGRCLTLARKLIGYASDIANDDTNGQRIFTEDLLSSAMMLCGSAQWMCSDSRRAS